MAQPIHTLLIYLTIGSLFSWTSVDEVFLFVRVGENYGTVYTPPPVDGAHFVFFKGEPIHVDLEIFNEGSEQVVVVANGMNPKDAFQMKVETAPTPDLKDKPILGFASSAKPIPTGAKAAAEWSERFVLPPQSGLKLQTTITSNQEDLPTGVYRLKFGCLLKSAAGQVIPAHSDTFSFELRSVDTAEDRLEVVRRQAMRFFTRGQYQEANHKLAELLRLYPNSAVAYTVQGHIAMALGKKDEAAVAYKRALDLLQSKMDTIYLFYASRSTVEDEIGLLSATLRSLQTPQ
jgi:hypothetical protein